MRNGWLSGLRIRRASTLSSGSSHQPVSDAVRDAFIRLSRRRLSSGFPTSAIRTASSRLANVISLVTPAIPVFFSSSSQTIGFAS